MNESYHEMGCLLISAPLGATHVILDGDVREYRKYDRVKNEWYYDHGGDWIHLHYIDNCVRGDIIRLCDLQTILNLVGD